MKWIINALLAIVALALLPWTIALAYMQLAGQVVEGKIISKRDAILLPGGDSWDHVFEITYSYRPLESGFPETAEHRVGADLFRHTQVGAIVPIRYSPSRMLRPIMGLGSFLDGASFFSRFGIEFFTAQHLAAVAAIFLGLFIGVYAYKTKSIRLGIFAVWIGVIPAPLLFLGITAFVVSPLLFWSWLNRKEGVCGWLLVASIPVTAVITYLQIPQSAKLAGESRQAMATVRQLRIVNEIWTSYGSDAEDPSGQTIRQPFQMVDLEFSPEPASGSIHALDLVDLNSLAGLREGGTVQVAYSSSNPCIARIIGGTRNYPRLNLEYLLGLTYGIAGILAFLVLPIARLVDKSFNSLKKILSLVSQEQSERISSRFPAGDPRRVAVEKAFQARKKRQSDTTKRRNPLDAS